MKWLLWKDYRHNRAIVFTALVLLLAPHLFVVYVNCGGPFPGLNAERSRPAAANRWTEGFAASSFFSLVISQFAIALMGGNAIAGERVDRSSEFLFSLPITRRRLLASKIFLALTIIAAIWMNALILSCLWYLTRAQGGGNPVLNEAIANTAIIGLVFFCVAWFLSAFTASPAYAVCGGLVSPLLVSSGIYFVAYLLDFPLEEMNAYVEPWFRAICLALAPPLFAVGTWYYLRRVEP